MKGRNRLIGKQKYHIGEIGTTRRDEVRVNLFKPKNLRL
tara:strand:- start:558 stop:674 length:117 start_codon:yes stop_codon:yes gene_type:complete